MNTEVIKPNPHPMLTPLNADPIDGILQVLKQNGGKKKSKRRRKTSKKINTLKNYLTRLFV